MLMGALGQWPRRTPNTPAASFAAAIVALREQSTPTTSPTSCSTMSAISPAWAIPKLPRAAISEARDIASKLRCQPLLGRTADITPAAIPGRG